MAPLELFCRGGDPRAMKGFIAASLSGADVAFTPMTAAVSGEARGAQIKLGELTDANAIARFLGNRGALANAFVPGGGPARWATERWTEWEATTWCLRREGCHGFMRYVGPPGTEACAQWCGRPQFCGELVVARKLAEEKSSPAEPSPSRSPEFGGEHGAEEGGGRAAEPHPGPGAGAHLHPEPPSTC